MATIISVTEKASGHRVLVNADHILMVRAISHGGCNVYLDSASIHAPDILTVADDMDDIVRRWHADARTQGDATIQPMHTPH